VTAAHLEGRTGPAGTSVTYRLRLTGHLDDHWSNWLGGIDLVHNDDATTTLTAVVVDQAQLHGLLARIRDIGAGLLSLNRVGASEAAGTAIRSGAPAPLQRALRTDRLVLRPATDEDADATWSYRRLDSVNEWLSGGPGTAEEYRTLFTEPSRLSATVVVELAGDLGGHPVGDLMLRREDAWSQAELSEEARGAQVELGWVLDPAHSGAGYASEAVRELLRYCFDELGVHRVVAGCFLQNDSSWRLMERVGMRRELHAVAESLHRSGRWLDTVGYALLADEWRRST